MGLPKPIHVRVSEHVNLEGLSASELARRLGWHEARAQRILRGETTITGDDIEAIAKVLRKPAGDLFFSPRAKKNAA